MKYQKYLDSLSTERKYCLLDRMRIDCEYFLGFGARHEKYLWAGNVEAQIESMLYRPRTRIFTQSAAKRPFTNGSAWSEGVRQVIFSCILFFFWFFSALFKASK